MARSREGSGQDEKALWGALPGSSKVGTRDPDVRMSYGRLVPWQPVARTAACSPHYFL